MGNYFSGFYKYIIGGGELQAPYEDKSEFIYAIYDPT